jgi:hypothetical protein
MLKLAKGMGHKLTLSGRNILAIIIKAHYIISMWDLVPHTNRLL